MAKKRECHDCWQYADFCKECGLGHCYWFTRKNAPTVACECKVFNDRYREQRKRRDKHAELMPLLEEFYEFLQKHKVPGGFHLTHLPKLTAKQAFTVIYVMQEYLHILPDSIEQCQECLQLYDSDCEGYYLDDQYELENGKTLPKKYWGHYCSESCHPNIECHLA